VPLCASGGGAPIGCVGDLMEFGLDGFLLSYTIISLNVEKYNGSIGNVEPLNF